MNSYIRKIGVLASLGLSLLSSSCTYTRAIALTNVPRERGKEIEARVERFMFLGIAFDNDDVPKLVDKLRDKCPNGMVRGILTKDLSTSYIIFVERKTIATGYCVKDNLVDDEITPETKTAELETEVAI